MLNVDQTRVTFIFLTIHCGVGKCSKRTLVCSYTLILPGIEQSTDVTSLSLAKFFHIWNWATTAAFNLSLVQLVAVKIEMSE